MDADASLHPSRDRRFGTAEALSGVRSRPTGFPGTLQPRSRPLLHAVADCTAPELPGRTEKAAPCALLERDQRWAKVDDHAVQLSPSPSATGWAGVLAVLGVLCTAVAVWALAGGASLPVPAQRALASPASAIDVSTFMTHEPHALMPGTSTYAPGQSSGWHRHPGLHLVNVVSGTLTVYDQDCTPETYGARQEYVGGEEPHLARNETAVTLEMAVTYLPRLGHTVAGFRVDEPSPPMCEVE